MWWSQKTRVRFWHHWLRWRIHLASGTDSGSNVLWAVESRSPYCCCSLMEMLNRLRSTVTQALPGNPITKDYEVLSHKASAGPALLWKVYDGIARSSKQASAKTVFEWIGVWHTVWSLNTTRNCPNISGGVHLHVWEEVYRSVLQARQGHHHRCFEERRRAVDTTSAPKNTVSSSPFGGIKVWLSQIWHSDLCICRLPVLFVLGFDKVRCPKEGHKTFKESKPVTLEVLLKKRQLFPKNGDILFWVE